MMKIESAVAKAVFQMRSTIGVKWAELSNRRRAIWLDYAKSLMNAVTPMEAWWFFGNALIIDLPPDRQTEVEWDFKVARDIVRKYDRPKVLA